MTDASTPPAPEDSADDPTRVAERVMTQFAHLLLTIESKPRHTVRMGDYFLVPAIPSASDHPKYGPGWDYTDYNGRNESVATDRSVRTVHKFLALDGHDDRKCDGHDYTASQARELAASLLAAADALEQWQIDSRREAGQVET